MPLNIKCDFSHNPLPDYFQTERDPKRCNFNIVAWSNLSDKCVFHNSNSVTLEKALSDIA